MPAGPAPTMMVSYFILFPPRCEKSAAVVFCCSRNSRTGGRWVVTRSDMTLGFTTLPPRFAWHPPLHREGYIAGFPKRFFEEKEFLGERARKRFLDKAPVGLCPLSSLETAHGACRFLTERGFYRARTAGVISVAFAVRRMPAKGAVNGVPKKDLRSKDFLGKGGTDVISVAFAVRRMPAKGVVFRRGAADRPRTDTPFGTGS